MDRDSRSKFLRWIKHADKQRVLMQRVLASGYAKRLSISRQSLASASRKLLSRTVIPFFSYPQSKFDEQTRKLLVQV
jgi:hypothetical protein